MTPTPRRRVVVVILLAVVLAAAAVADRSKPAASNAAARVGADGPHAADLGSEPSSWFCMGGPEGDPLTTTVSVANPTAEDLSGTVTVFSVGAAPVKTALGVKAGSVVSLNVAGPGPWGSALVDLFGGGAVVEQSVSGAAGTDTTPCSSTASARWYFAGGSTAKDATESLVLFNPFPDLAVVDLAFATGEGRRVPGDFQNLVVGPQSVRVVDIGAHVRHQDVVSTEVKARNGRVVAGQMLIRTAPGVAGVSTTLGAPSLGERWYFPDGLVSATVAEKYEVFNPNDKEAQVDIALALEKDEIEPFELTVPAQGRVTLVLNSENRVPKDVAHAALAESVNGVPVVVTRVIESGAPRQGRADTLGARGTARKWALAVGSTSPTVDEWVIVQNPGSSSATVSFTALADGQRLPVEGLQNVVVPAGRRLAFRLSDHIKRDVLPLVVSSSRAVVVERALYNVGAPGLSSSLGIPLD